MDARNDFSKGSIVKNIISMAIPLTLAQLVNVLYNIVDRIYISMIPDIGFTALTGLGICLPAISIVAAFANLFGMGGAPLCSIERGRSNHREAEMIMGNSFVMLVASGIGLTVLGILVRRPMLYLFGASDTTYPYAESYLTIYMLGNVFVMISLGMNNFINSQGFGRTGMLTVVIGAVLNIILDPVFIFVLGMGVQGAAIATIISQGVSAVWVLKFLTGKKAIYTLTRNSFNLNGIRVRRILGLGISGFVMQATNSLIQFLCNSTLQVFGGDLYVGIMTVVNSVREVVAMPVVGLTSGAQPVIGFNYGAGKYDRVKSSISFITAVSLGYSVFVWLLIQVFPDFFIRIFDDSPAVIQAGIPSTRIFFMGFFFMSLQFAGQTIFLALAKSRHAVFFSIFRKVVLVMPLVILLPRIGGLGTTGVFLSEPISELIGGIACFTTMMVVVWRRELKGNPR
jgi:putative MATE family efflux protein